jgi:uncharacterized alkaline shock family protein YloU
MTATTGSASQELAAAKGVAPAPIATTTSSAHDGRGSTMIAEDVVAVIARLAAEQVPGVHKIGESSLRGMFARFGRSKGVDAEVGMEQAAVDLEVVVDYGHPIPGVARQLREAIIEAVEHMTGRQVVEVNIDVVDVYLPKVEKRQTRRELR